MSSFLELYAELRQRQPKGHPVWRHANKLDGRALAASLGVRVPALLSGPAPIGELEEPLSFERRPVVLKCDEGCSGHLVRPLQRSGGFEGQWRCLWNVGLQGTLAMDTWEGWQRWAAEAQARTAAAGNASLEAPWFVEAAVSRHGELADTWKLLTIGGWVVYLRQVRIYGPRERYHRPWTRFGEPITVSVDGHPVESRMQLAPPPAHVEALVKTAELLAAHVESPMVRIDLYLPPDGVPVFGEVTPHPGEWRREWHPWWDAHLGELLEAAMRTEAVS